MFETLRRVFRHERPTPVIQDAVLGTLTWSPEEESWVGRHSGRDFSLLYDGSAMPSQPVREYALRVLGDHSWLDHTLAEAKTVAEHAYSPFYTSEIRSLVLGALHFSVHRTRGEYLLADLNGGRDDRLWRIEYSGVKCEGIGFDR